jgi:hypothetical protein
MGRLFFDGQWPLLVDFFAAALNWCWCGCGCSASQPLTDSQIRVGKELPLKTFFPSRRCAAIRTHNTAAFSCRDAEWLFNGRPRTALWEEDHLAALLGEREVRGREVSMSGTVRYSLPCSFSTAASCCRNMAAQ